MQQLSQHMVKVGTLIGVLGLCLVFALIGCSSDSESGFFSYAALGEGPEPSPDLTLIDTLGFYLAGAQLVMSYDSATHAFTGTVENTTKATLRRVRVEVHLSNGIKLGPTIPVDLTAGQVVEISLPAGSQLFTFWSAYLEVG